MQSFSIQDLRERSGALSREVEQGKFSGGDAAWASVQTKPLPNGGEPYAS